MKRNLLIFVSFILLGTMVFAQGSQTNDLLKNKLNTITTAVPFLLIAPDARGGGLGDAGAASSPDANSMHWNPAKYGFIDKDFGFSVSYSPWLHKLVNDINLAYLGAYKRINKRQVVSMSLRYFSLGNITFTNETGQNIGQYKPNEFSLDASYCFKFTNEVSGAIALRYIYSNLTGGIYVAGAQSKAGQAVAADISVFYEKPIDIKGMETKFTLGANISNIGNKISYTENLDRDFIPTNLRLGFGYEMNFDKNNSLALLLDFNKLLVPTPPIYQLDSTGKYVYDVDGNKIIEKGKDPNVGVVRGMVQSFYDAPDGFKEEMKEINIAVGLEYWYAKQFSIRAGYFNEASTKGNRKYVTLGAGLRYSIFGLDFAYLIPVTQRNPLENTLRFSLLFNFDKVKAKKEKEGEEIKKNE
ncbi:MAG TPA: type IX secretion system outer membrane channel protein PorV [Bacteroidales bacterium]|nr:type IX secretion system outer membrane channel protein PorV [Bacteroidales bacterium]HOH83941.1 type IX secretion system outer membrane channel protein PorV [Bacteroidales bacterium]HPB25693.1 type IX secretion system outer membrane channel protein PorV [Bacteroidales bacterium]HQN16260.1 type IX secretion system outer membrane channel protein PorV [Bacteroidales bacterium]HQP15832.1 type IX secretion system outer membrane channel protein PorV [Bacteroidales bacterium]